jgi:hypothetical protein
MDHFGIVAVQEMKRGQQHLKGCYAVLVGHAKHITVGVDKRR